MSRFQSTPNRQAIVTFCSGFLAGLSCLSLQAFRIPQPLVVVNNMPVPNVPIPQRKSLHVEDGKPEVVPPLQDSVDDHTISLFPDSIRHLVAGMARVSRTDFAKQFDIGYGIDRNTPHNSQVLLLFGSADALPTNSSLHGSTVPYQSLDEATENCDTVKVVLTSIKPDPIRPKRDVPHKECVAVMGQWESAHVHKFSRDESTKSMVYQKRHYKEEPPTLEETKANQQALLDYLTVYDDALEKLKPLAAKAAGDTTSEEPIIVMVANYGQAQFFINFLCAAAARQLDTSRVLLFATDQETYQLAQSMNVTVFYDDRIFRSIPSGAAVDYQDMNYGRIMMSKVYCVHMVNALGYDLLFQDLDLVWYKNPLEYFTQKLASEETAFDMYFQHDGTHHPERFAPLAANTGFYYVRHNERTRHFFDVFVRMGDLVITDRSHQAALTTLVNEHMSLRGLRVKVLAEDTDMFLSGYHRHARKRIIKRTIAGYHKPYLYHVNWMTGAEKQPVLRDSLNWYTKEECTGKSPALNLTKSSDISLFSACCLSKPMKAEESAT